MEERSLEPQAAPIFNFSAAEVLATLESRNYGHEIVALSLRN